MIIISIFFILQIFKDYVTMKKEEVLKASRPVATYGFALTCSNCVILEQDRFYSPFEDIAPLLPVLDFIQLNEIYAVLNKDGKWYRATLSVPYCDGIFQVYIYLYLV